MKIAAATVALAAASVDASAVRGFGPASCVSVSRSSTGTCVLNTKCAGQDLSSFDISFQCVGESGRQTHSMGKGSFDVEEEYDTDMKCQKCLPPTGAGESSGVSLAAISVSRELGKLRASHEPQKEAPKAEKEKEAEEAPPQAEWYGPESCLGVWKEEKSGTCVMQTDCDKDTQLDVYEFGLICIDQDKEMTRHLFGMGSFAHKETFSTLIKCDQCRALDEYMDGNKAVGVLAKSVKGMKDDMTGVSADVLKLKAQVFPQGAPAPAPAVAGAAPAGSAKPSKFLVVAKEQLAPATPEKAAEPSQVQPRPAAKTKTKPEVVVEQQVTKDVVQHVKRKASQAAAVAQGESSSVGDILAAAVKGAEARGDIKMGAEQAVLERAGYKVPMNPRSVTQTASQVKHAVAPLGQPIPPHRSSNLGNHEAIEYVEDKSKPASEEEDDTDDDDDGFR